MTVTTRMCTAAIPGYTIPEVRRGLDEVRRTWEDEECPFYLHQPLLTLEGAHAGTPTHAFCTAFLVGQHLKRKAKRARQSTKHKR